MRLDRLKIGSDKASPTHQFKNLKNVSIDFDQGHWVTVMIGWNGTGKSNVLEALAIIFRDLIEKKRRPAFAFEICYRIGSGESARSVHIDADPDRQGSSLTIRVAVGHVDLPAGQLTPEELDEQPWRPIEIKEFESGSGEYLPRYVFSYYSGESTRMQEVFLPYLKNYYQNLLSNKELGLKKLFYALPVHSQFVLLAFLVRPDARVAAFLQDQLGIDPETGIESVLFVLRQPPWKSRAGDPRFWNARGVVQKFLDRLMTVAIAPVEVSRPIYASIWNKNRSTREYKYLFVKDIGSLRRLVGAQASNEFFRDLESTYVSELIEEVRIRVRLSKNDGSVTFRELSEGEQQLLTVMGLLRFTSEEESLFLLDEPDTHLNPRWSVDYLKHLQDFVGPDEVGRATSHIVMTTHNPLAIAELEQEQIQILYRNGDSGKISAEQPALAPRGMGYSGIVTSDMFGLGSSLDGETNRDLLDLHRLAAKKDLSVVEKADLARLRSELSELDFNFGSRDRLEQEYLRARFDLANDSELTDAIVSPENKARALKALIEGLLRSTSESEE